MLYTAPASGLKRGVSPMPVYILMLPYHMETPSFRYRIRMFSLRLSLTTCPHKPQILAQITVQTVAAMTSRTRHQQYN